mmetsp:Transcript_14756/g.21915  ORF Transcript_14756/g.21915 Transcript_14756/m.21915 type:complete len:480 (-) Transcript_14756:11-1450(-)
MIPSWNLLLFQLLMLNYHVFDCLKPQWIFIGNFRNDRYPSLSNYVNEYQQGDVVKGSIVKCSISPAEAVDKASTPYELLQASCLLVARGQEKLHFQKQPIHQRRRQTTASNAMIKLTKLLVGSSYQISNLRSEILSSPHFLHLVTCAFDPINVNEVPMNEEEYKCYYKSLKSYSILHPLDSIPLVLRFITSAFQRIDQYIAADVAKKCTAAQIDALHTAYLRIFNTSLTLNALEDRYKQLQLPFKLLHGVVRDQADVDALVKEVPFKAENLITMGGKRVTERRETCFMADAGVGGLAYSGKIMSPQPYSPLVAAIRDRIEAATAVYYDCCLINLYRDGECACAYHSDPDMGTVWARDTAVVSIGETRRFHLRPKIVTSTASSSQQKSVNVEDLTHCFHVSHGDVMLMFGDCQEVFEHAVLTQEGPQNSAARVSLVFKKSLPGLGGRRGHGGTKVVEKKMIKKVEQTQRGAKKEKKSMHK